MIIQILHCPHCQGTDIVRHGKSPEGKQRYRCRECREGRGRTFLLDYAYAGQAPEVKQQIVEMAMNASGIRDTARVLKISPTTVIKELKKGPGPAPGESRGVAAPQSRTGGGRNLSR
jgi:transposase-like protein